MFKYRKVLKYLNRAAYLASAAMMMAGLIFTVLPASEVAAGEGDTCPDSAPWIKIEPLLPESITYTYSIPAGKEVAEVCYKAGDDTYSYSVIPPVTGSITITNDQFFNKNGIAHALSHASFRLQDSATPTETTPPPTETTPPPTETTPPPTETTPPPTETTPPPTETTPPPTETTPPPTETTPPPTETTPPPTETTPPPVGTTPPPINVLDPLFDYDPYCTADGRMQWTIENPNTVNFNISYWTLDGGPQQPGFSAAPGSTIFTTTPLGTHTIRLFYGESQSVSFTHTILVCPLQIPGTGSGVIIPVTGADLTQPLSGWFFGGFGMFGFGMVLTGLRKKFNL